MSHPRKHIVYKAKRPLKAVTGTPPVKDVEIPAGSVLVWNHGDATGEMAHVSWLRHRVHVKGVDLLSHCEQITDDSDTVT